MIFTETRIPGVWIIETEPRGDERGWFARGWCAAEFAAHGLDARIEQVNLARTERAGTLRGMHWQADPHGECKLVRCTRGALYDVIVDLREESPTFGQWIGVELTADNFRQLFVPGRFAHGFLTLAPHTDAAYQVSAKYTPGAERGLRWNDPALSIEWPAVPQLVSAKDQVHPDFEPTTGILTAR